ncbi:tyrosyl-DNA phosphodiesterase-domain-containing protein [Hyaloraphidium curvatum]|nr:tyrosyl-DNA phosphodiesterase-domain-containing protein [Hyaloraphidium curvatum]
MESDDEHDAPSRKKKLVGFRPRIVLNKPGPRARRRAAAADSTDDEADERQAGPLPADRFLVAFPEKFVLPPGPAAVAARAALEAFQNRQWDASGDNNKDTAQLTFDGSRLFCNRLAGEPIDEDRPYVALQDVVGDKGVWSAFFVTSMVVDPRMIHRYFPMREGVQATFVSHQRHWKPSRIQAPNNRPEPPGIKDKALFERATADRPVQIRGAAPYPSDSGRLPTFSKVADRSVEEDRMDWLWQMFAPSGFGSVHGKIVVLRSPACLRVCITSSNMSGEWERIRESVWVQDFPVIEGAGEGGEEPPPGLPLVYAASPVGREFAHHLVSYLVHLRVPADRLRRLLDGADFTSARASLICSVPLRTRDPDVRQTAGHFRLRSLLSAVAWPTPGREPVRVITGSVGNLKPRFLVEMATTLTGDRRHPLGRFPGLRFTSVDTPEDKEDKGLAVPKKGSYTIPSTFPDIRILFPTEARAMVSSMNYPDSVNMHKSFYHADAFPRELFEDGPANPAFRAGIEIKGRMLLEPLAHSKNIWRRAAIEPGGGVPDGYAAGWAYAGSHNLSENAWGTFGGPSDGEWTWNPARAGRKREEAGQAEGNKGKRRKPPSYSLNSFEIGVLLVARTPAEAEALEGAMPLVPGEKYGPNTIPYTFGSTLQGGHRGSVAGFMAKRRRWLEARGIGDYFPDAQEAAAQLKLLDMQEEEAELEGGEDGAEGGTAPAAEEEWEDEGEGWEGEEGAEEALETSAEAAGSDADLVDWMLDGEDEEEAGWSDGAPDDDAEGGLQPAEDQIRGTSSGEEAASGRPRKRKFEEDEERALEEAIRATAACSRAN